MAIKSIKILAGNQNLRKAKKLFLSGKYAESMRSFNDVYMINPSNKEALIGILLCDIASDNEEQAHKLFEYYQIIKAQKVPNAREIMLDLISILDSNSNHFVSMINDEEDSRISDIDGILYSDFMELAKKSDFRTMFEYSFLSTKIIFTKKSDFYEFLNLLIDNNFIDLSVQYIEALHGDISNDFEIQKILKRALKE